MGDSKSEVTVIRQEKQALRLLIQAPDVGETREIAGQQTVMVLRERSSDRVVNRTSGLLSRT